MITIELRLPVYTVVALFCWVLALPPAGLSIYLCAHFYKAASLQVSSGLLGGFLILSAVSVLVSGILPQRFGSFVALVASSVCTGVAGLYWASACFNSATTPERVRFETPLLILWVLFLVLSFSLTTATLVDVQTRQLAAAAVAASSPELGSEASAHALKTGASLTQLRSMVSERALPSPSPPLHQFTWPDSSPTLHIDGGRDLQLGKALRARGSLGSLTSLKRKHKHNKSAPPPNIPSLSGLEAVPEGFADLDWELTNGDAGDNIRWILEHASGSRNVSGSTQRSGSLFSVANYNRKINDAGFQHEEPVPARARIRSQVSFSQYDRERMRQSVI